MENLSPPTVVIVILNWNGLSYTLSCLQSVYQLEYPCYEIVVVDNASSEPVESVRELFPDTVVIRNDDNLGYAGGNNVGIKYAIERGAKYVWILNNDTVVESDCLLYLVEHLENASEIGAVTNLILYMEDKNERCWFGGGIIEGGISVHWGMGQLYCELEEPPRTDYVSGCSFLARVNLMEKLEGFDEDFFCYSEDLDISLRIIKLGYKLGYQFRAVVHHKVSASVGHMSKTKIYYKYRNKIYFLKKHKYPFTAFVHWYATSLRYVISLTVKHHQPALSWTLLIALRDGAIGKLGKRRG